VSEPTGKEVAVGLLVFAFLAALVLVGKACWANHVYGDWTCAFSECRREFK
jgi:hypothetical protein